MSSKIKVPIFREVVPIKKDRSRDPRFDSLCGTFIEKVNKAIDIFYLTCCLYYFS